MRLGLITDLQQAHCRRRASGIVTVRRESIRLGEPTGRREPVFSPAAEQWSFDGTSWSFTSLVDECV